MDRVTIYYALGAPKFVRKSLHSTHSSYITPNVLSLSLINIADTKELVLRIEKYRGLSTRKSYKPCLPSGKAEPRSLFSPHVCYVVS